MVGAVVIVPGPPVHMTILCKLLSFQSTCMVLVQPAVTHVRTQTQGGGMTRIIHMHTYSTYIIQMILLSSLDLLCTVLCSTYKYSAIHSVSIPVSTYFVITYVLTLHSVLSLYVQSVKWYYVIVNPSERELNFSVPIKVLTKHIGLHICTYVG